LTGGRIYFAWSHRKEKTKHEKIHQIDHIQLKIVILPKVGFNAATDNFNEPSLPALRPSRRSAGH
jgi:hypothetical protein